MTKQRQSRIALLAVAMLLSGALFGFVMSDNASAGTTYDINGRVQPFLDNATVTILNSETGISKDTQTLEDGFYSFDDIDSGSYLVRFTKSGYLSKLVMWEIDSTGSMDDVSMAEITSGTTEISGKITDGDGNVTGANISIRSVIQLEDSWWNGTDVGYTWTTTTDSDGNYTFSDLPDESSFDVRIESDNHYTYVGDTTSSSFVITKVNSDNNQNVGVKDSLGKIINDATVFMYDTATSTWTSSSKLGGATYILSPAVGSEIYVYAYHDDYEPSVKRIESVAGTDTLYMIVGKNDAATNSVIYISTPPSNGAQSSIPRMGERVIKENPDPSASITVTSDYTDMDGVYVVANGEQVNFSGLFSSSPVGIHQYSWSFGTSDVNASYFFMSGSTVVNLTVFDAFGDVSTSNVTIMADGSNPNPVVNVTVKASSSDEGEPYNGSNVNEYCTGNPTQCPGGSHTVVFNASESNDADSIIVSYDWDFDDENTDTGAVVSHSFQDPGSFDVKLTVTDAAGNIGSSITTIEVNDIEKPIASFIYYHINDNGSQVNWSAIEGIPTHFDAGETEDNSQDSLTYIWDFGDGINGTGVATTHIFNETRDEGFNVILVVTDASNNEEQAVGVVSVAKMDRPDIYVSNFTFSNDSPSEGDIVEINATIRLLGINLTEPFAVTFYLDGCPCLSGDAPNGTIIGTVEVNQSSLVITDDITNPSYSVQITWTATAGTHTLYVWVDANEAIDEGLIGSNEEKNYLSKSITVSSDGNSRDWTSIGLIVIVILMAFGAVGYIYRDSLFK